MKSSRELHSVADVDLRKRIEALKDADPEKAELLFEYASQQVNGGKFGEAMKSFQACRRLAVDTGDIAVASRSLVTMGYLYARIGEYTAAISCFTQCVVQLNDGDDDDLAGAAWLAIGGVHDSMNNAAEAIKSYERSAALFKASGNRLGEVEARTKLASFQGRTGPLAPSLAELLRVLVFYEELGLKDKVAELILEIGRLYQRHNETQQALTYLEMARVRAHEIGLKSIEGVALLHIARMRLTMGRTNESLRLITEGLAIASMIGDEHLASLLHEVAAATYEAQDDPATALAHYKEFLKHHQGDEHVRQQEVFTDMSTRLSLRHAEHERERSDTQTQQLRRHLLEKTHANVKLGLQLIQQSNIVEELKERIGKLKDVAHCGDDDERTLEAILDDIDVDGGSWRIFEEQFDESHHEFLHNLAAKHPSLTKMELRICSLMRLSLDTKEIARILYVSVRNIQNHRYRLRKRLELPATTGLVTYLAGI